MRRSSENMMRSSRFLRTLAFVLLGIATGACFERGYNRETRLTENAPRNAAIVEKKVSEGKFLVVKIVDGDTLDVIDGANNLTRVRLAGIDAPEKGQPFSKVAKNSLSEMVFKREVTLDGDKVDRWKRRVAKVSTDHDVCLEMIRKGLAWHFKKYEDEQSEQDRAAYNVAEQQARAARLGLWSEVSPIPPWEIRESKRSGSGVK